MTGPQNATQVTDERGEAHFLALPPGTYNVAVKLSGFSDYQNQNVGVVVGGSTPLRATLAVSGVAQTVEVMAEGSPIIDPKGARPERYSPRTAESPSSRDPWVVLQPTVSSRRVTSAAPSRGSSRTTRPRVPAAREHLEHRRHRDYHMSALGSSPTYYDFDMFQEMQVTTGGADLTAATGGVALNFVLKSGTNTPHGSTRIYYENESMQANNLPADLAASLGGVTGKGNRMDEYKDYGFELGGPILRDRLWAWGAYGKTDVTLLTLANTPDQTILENLSFKASGQATDALRGSFTFFRGDKLKYGRGAGVTPHQTTWDRAVRLRFTRARGTSLSANPCPDRPVFVCQWRLCPHATGRARYAVLRHDTNTYRKLALPLRDDSPAVHAAPRATCSSVETKSSSDSVAARGRRFADDRPGHRHHHLPHRLSEHDGRSDGLEHTVSAQGIYTHAYVGDTISGIAFVNAASDGIVNSSSTSSRSGQYEPGDLLPISPASGENVVVWNSVRRVSRLVCASTKHQDGLRASYAYSRRNCLHQALLRASCRR